MRHAFRTVTACSALLLAAEANAACERHVYNNSNAPWTIYGRSVAVDSHVYFGDFCGNVRDGICVLPPHSVMTITYTTIAGLTSVHVGFADVNRKGAVFLTGGTAGNCPATRHDGATGSVSVNEPADGDFTIDQDTMDGPLPPKPPEMRTKPMPAPPPAPGGKVRI